MADNEQRKEEPEVRATAPKAAKRQTEYTHTTCETDNVMSPEMEDRYYSHSAPVNSLYCGGCGAGYRIGEDGEMVWKGTKDKVPEHE